MQLFKPQEAANRLSVARTLVLKWIAEGKLPCVVLGVGPSFARKAYERKGKLIKPKRIEGKRIVRIKESDLEKFISAHENKVAERSTRRLRVADGSHSRN